MRIFGRFSVILASFRALCRTCQYLLRLITARAFVSRLLSLLTGFSLASFPRRYHDSARARDHQVHRVVLTALLGEWPLLSRYPEKEIKLSGRLFGRLIQMGLTISDGILALMLRHTFEALRLGSAGLSPKLLTWGVSRCAFGRFSPDFPRAFRGLSVG